jgi:1,4-alpha-glucan branching enzyme
MVSSFHIQNEEAARRKVMQSEMKKLQTDLNRIRANRDQLQQQLDRRTAKDDSEFIQNQEIRVIANTRKVIYRKKKRILYLFPYSEMDVMFSCQERVASLLLENRRLKMKIAADNGDKEAVDFYSVNEELSLVESLREKLQ